MEAPPTWTLLFTGLITGIAVGVFGCFLLYLSGKVPPLQPQSTAMAREIGPAEPVAEVVAATELPEDPAVTAADDTVDLDFYRELPEYEVVVDATPVPLPAELAEQRPAAGSTQQPAANGPQRLLQIGAFAQNSSAETQIGMLDELGVDAFITQQLINGRLLHLVRAGPFSSTVELNNIRSLLQRNDINSFPLDLR